MVIKIVSGYDIAKPPLSDFVVYWWLLKGGFCFVRRYSTGTRLGAMRHNFAWDIEWNQDRPDQVCHAEVASFFLFTLQVILT